jgi:hypothetical protein
MALYDILHRLTQMLGIGAPYGWGEGYCMKWDREDQKGIFLGCLHGKAQTLAQMSGDKCVGT